MNKNINNITNLKERSQILNLQDKKKLEEAVIDVNGLTKRYKDFVALDNLNLQVTGSTVKIVAANSGTNAANNASDSNNSNTTWDNTANNNASSTSSTSAGSSSAKGQDSDGDGIPDIAEKTIGTDPNLKDTDGDVVNDLQDKDPVFAENPINNNSANEGFQIVNGIVENNVDPVTKKAVSDHLELTLKNTSGKELKGFEFL